MGKSLTDTDECRKLPTVDQADQYLSAAEVAALLGVTDRTLYGWRGQKTGPPCQRFGKSYRYPQEALRAWMDAQWVVRPAER